MARPEKPYVAIRAEMEHCKTTAAQITEMKSVGARLKPLFLFRIACISVPRDFLFASFGFPGALPDRLPVGIGALG